MSHLTVLIHIMITYKNGSKLYVYANRPALY